MFVCFALCKFYRGFFCWHNLQSYKQIKHKRKLMFLFRININ